MTRPGCGFRTASILAGFWLCASWMQAAPAGEIARPSGTAHWAFQPIRRPAIPSVRNAAWVRNPIDAFIAAEHENRGLVPAPEAGRRTLIRRLWLDLLGVPPETDAVRSFERETEGDAYERLADRLLASPLLGERWGRHWLDVARWAESEGYAENNTRPSAWRYRDFVVQSFNDDKPFDLFLRQQVAGDEMDPPADENIIGTGFLAAARLSADEGDRWRQRNDMLVDITDATASAFLGITLQCAQCHDHKFDPITQRDYYRFQGFFIKGLPGNLVIGGTAPRAGEPGARPPEYDKVMAEYHAILGRARVRGLELGIRELPAETQRILGIPPEARTLLEERTARAAESHLNFRVAMNALEPKMTEEDRKRFGELKKQVGELEARIPPPPSTWGFYSPATAAREMDVLLMRGNFPLLHDRRELEKARPYLLTRGDVFQPEAPLDPGWPAVFGAIDAETEQVLQKKPRLALAQWLAGASHPLTARVWANRIWHYHFGRGLVETPSDFGLQGAPPSNPLLLDWLAAELIQGGWSAKRLHRLIIGSSTYRQAAAARADNARIDPDNRCWWRWSPRRLEAETLRDVFLAASGELDRRIGGPPAPADQAAPSLRRSIYLMQKRDSPPEMQSLFDGPAGMAESCPRRHMSISPLQSLYLLNNAFSLQRARELSLRLERQGGSEEERRTAAFEAVLGRPPEAEELEAVNGFFNRYENRVVEGPAPGIVRIFVPRGSQVPPARPAVDDCWDAGGPGVLFEDDRGIGAIVSAADQAYCLHNTTPGPTAYTGYTPDPQRAVVTYEFEAPATISQLELVVHRNGIIRIEGFAGDDAGRLESIGEASTPDAARDRPFAEERSAHRFSFDPSRVRPGKFFRFIVRETALATGFANYQAFPMLGDGSRAAGRKFQSAWIGYCQSLFNLSECAYIY